MTEAEMSEAMIDAVRDLLGGEDMCPYTDEVLEQLAGDFIEIANAYKQWTLLQTTRRSYE